MKKNFKVITNQHHIRENEVDNCLEHLALNHLKDIEIPNGLTNEDGESITETVYDVVPKTLFVVDALMNDDDGNPLYILVDKMAWVTACKILEIPIYFDEIKDNTMTKSGDSRLEAYSTNEGEWFYAETGVSVW